MAGRPGAGGHRLCAALTAPPVPDAAMSRVIKGEGPSKVRTKVERKVPGAAADRLAGMFPTQLPVLEQTPARLRAFRPADAALIASVARRTLSFR